MKRFKLCGHFYEVVNLRSPLPTEKKWVPERVPWVEIILESLSGIK